MTTITSIEVKQAENHALWSWQIWMFATATIAIIIDQLTKWWIEDNLKIGESIFPYAAIDDIFRIIHVYNTGAAYGSFEGFGWVFSIVAFVVAGFIIYYNYSLLKPHYLFRVALGLILGGAMGNVIDRLRIGWVTDWIYFNFRPLVADYPALDFQLLDIPVFNFADTFIISAVLLLGFMMITNRLPEDEDLGSSRVAPTPTTQVMANQPKLPFQPIEIKQPEPELQSEPPSSPAPAAAEPETPTDNRLARYGMWAIIILAVAVVVWLVVFLFTWQRSRWQRDIKRGRERRREEKEKRDE